MSHLSHTNGRTSEAKGNRSATSQTGDEAGGSCRLPSESPGHCVSDTLSTIDSLSLGDTSYHTSQSPLREYLARDIPFHLSENPNRSQASSARHRTMNSLSSIDTTSSIGTTDTSATRRSPSPLGECWAQDNSGLFRPQSPSSSCPRGPGHERTSGVTTILNETPSFASGTFSSGRPPIPPPLTPRSWNRSELHRPHSPTWSLGSRRNPRTTDSHSATRDNIPASVTTNSVLQCPPSPRPEYHTLDNTGLWRPQSSNVTLTHSQAAFHRPTTSSSDVPHDNMFLEVPATTGVTNWHPPFPHYWHWGYLDSNGMWRVHGTVVGGHHSSESGPGAPEIIVRSVAHPDPLYYHPAHYDPRSSDSESRETGEQSPASSLGSEELAGEDLPLLPSLDGNGPTTTLTDGQPLVPPRIVGPPHDLVVRSEGCFWDNIVPFVLSFFRTSEEMLLYSLQCPLTKTLMVHPFVDLKGESYELEAVVDYWQDPATLQSWGHRRNLALEDFLEQFSLRPYSMATQKTLECPISQHMMQHPVIDAEGHSYEERDIVAWIDSFEDGICPSPYTREPLKKSHLRPNKTLKRVIEQYRKTLESVIDY